MHARKSDTKSVRFGPFAGLGGQHTQGLTLCGGLRTQQRPAKKYCTKIKDKLKY
jgi:hypothetical protein